MRSRGKGRATAFGGHVNPASRLQQAVPDRPHSDRVLRSALVPLPTASSLIADSVWWTYPGQSATETCTVTVSFAAPRYPVALFAQSKLEPHPILAQVPLTVSPFISLPTATTLPYTYKPLPSTLPPSSTADANGIERDKYVVSASGHAASPADIIASCQALQAHIQKTQEDAEKAIKNWETSLREEELAEKRRVAPGWLDRNEKILEPEKKISGITQSFPNHASDITPNVMDNRDTVKKTQSEHHSLPDAAGEELDRVFGGITI